MPPLMRLWELMAGMAATRPSAVAKSASAMPGAMMARLASSEAAMPWKEFMMPKTVPNRPTKGETAPIVARPGSRACK